MQAIMQHSRHMPVRELYPMLIIIIVHTLVAAAAAAAAAAAPV